MIVSANLYLRPARRSDTREMAGIVGGQTTPQALADWMDDGLAHAAWHVIEDDAGRLWGFQRIGGGGEMSKRIGEIATFLRDGAPLAVGSRLFDATQNAARLLGYHFIDARIARENEGARTYYQSHGFRRASQSDTHVIMRYEVE